MCFQINVLVYFNVVLFAMYSSMKMCIRCNVLADENLLQTSLTHNALKPTCRWLKIKAITIQQGRSSPLGTVGTCLHVSVLKVHQHAAAAIHICVMYRPDQPALSAQTDPADTFRLREDR